MYSPHWMNITTVSRPLNQELFQLQMGWKRDSIGLGCASVKTPSGSCGIIPRTFSSGLCSQVEVWLLLWWAAWTTQGNGSQPEGQHQWKDVLWLSPGSKGSKKEEAVELSHSKAANSTSKPKVMSFFPLQKLKGTQPARTPAVLVVHLEGNSTDKEEGAKSEDPNGIEGVTKKFIVCLAQAVKEAQQEKYCYHCSSPEHFLCNCPLGKASRNNWHWNQTEGMALKKGVMTPPGKVTMSKALQEGTPKV